MSSKSADVRNGSLSEVTPLGRWNLMEFSRPVAICALAGLFVILYFVSRYPFSLEPLRDEDGIFANIMLHRVAGPNYTLIARIDGIDHWIPPAHPGLTYDTLGVFGKVAYLPRLIGRRVAVSDFVTLRRAAAAVQLTVLIMLFPLLFRSGRATEFPSQRTCALLFFAAWIIIPLSIATSVDLQIDGTTGVLFVGLLSAALLHTDFLGKAAPLLIFLGAFACGTGKWIWAVPIAASALLMLAGLLLMHLLGRKPGDLPNSRSAIPYGVVLLGVVAGQLCSYWYDPLNFVREYALAKSFSAVAGDTTVLATLERNWLDLFQFPLVFLLVGWGLVGLVRSRSRVRLHILFLFLTALALFSVYAASTRYFARYFAPANLLLLATALGLFIGDPLPRSWRRACLVVTVLIATVSGYNLYERVQKLQDGYVNRQLAWINGDNGARTAYGKAHGCVPLLGIAYALEHPDLEFVANSGGLEGARALLAEFHRVPCDPSASQ
jgi:hypothetical protein